MPDEFTTKCQLEIKVNLNSFNIFINHIIILHKLLNLLLLPAGLLDGPSDGVGEVVLDRAAREEAEAHAQGRRLAEARDEILLALRRASGSVEDARAEIAQLHPLERDLLALLTELQQARLVEAK